MIRLKLPRYLCILYIVFWIRLNGMAWACPFPSSARGGWGRQVLCLPPLSWSLYLCSLNACHDCSRSHAACMLAYGVTCLRQLGRYEVDVTSLVPTPGGSMYSWRAAGGAGGPPGRILCGAFSSFPAGRLPVIRQKGLREIIFAFLLIVFCPKAKGNIWALIHWASRLFLIGQSIYRVQ